MRPAPSRKHSVPQGTAPTADAHRGHGWSGLERHGENGFVGHTRDGFEQRRNSLGLQGLREVGRTARGRRQVRRRGALAASIAVLALAAASCTTAGDTSTSDAPVPAGNPVAAADRAQAALADCPNPSGAPVADGPLRGLTLNCLADGRPVDLTAALAGKPALLNLWAYWCGPCAEELPLLQQFSDRAAGAVTVLTVHSDPGTSKGLSRLIGLGVHLPGVEDPDTKVRNAVGAPAVLPISVLLRADGTVAKLIVRPFKSVDDISATVAAELGVKA